MLAHACAQEHALPSETAGSRRCGRIKQCALMRIGRSQKWPSICGFFARYHGGSAIASHVIWFLKLGLLAATAACGSNGNVYCIPYTQVRAWRPHAVVEHWYRSVCTVWPQRSTRDFILEVLGGDKISAAPSIYASRNQQGTATRVQEGDCGQRCKMTIWSCAAVVNACLRVQAASTRTAMRGQACRYIILYYIILYYIISYCFILYYVILLFINI